MTLAERVAAGTIVTLTRAELEQLIETEARAMLGCSAAEAFARIARGELRGSVAAAELTSLKELLDAE